MVRAPLKKVAKMHGLYLDHKHARAARNGRKKVSWTDHRGNTHDLDYVLEHGGSERVQGSPKAFIESAWRRYTKHSRNKAQEIQGAVSVLAETYSQYNPFLGVVLAGVFTDGSLQQLKSHGFSIVYCSYETVIKAFAAVGIDAEFDESTTDKALQKKVDEYESLSKTQKTKLVRKLRRLIQDDLDRFVSELENTLTRRIERILIATLHGPTCEVTSIDEAIGFIDGYVEDGAVAGGFVRYEVIVRYTNGDQINGQFEEKRRAIGFLNALV